MNCTLGRKIFLHNLKFSQFSHMLQNIRKRYAIYFSSIHHFASLSEVRGINGSQVLSRKFLPYICKFLLEDLDKLSRENL